MSFRPPIQTVPLTTRSDPDTQNQNTNRKARPQTIGKWALNTPLYTTNIQLDDKPTTGLLAWKDKALTRVIFSLQRKTYFSLALSGSHHF